MALSAVTGTSLKIVAVLNPQLNLTGTDYQPNVNQSIVSKAIAFVLGGNVALGINQIVSVVTTIAASGSLSIDLTALTNLLQQASVNLARVKAIILRVLSVADDATNGTAAVGVTVDNTVANALSSQANSGWFNNAAEGAGAGSRFCIPNGAILVFATPSAAGVLVDGTHKIIKLTNLDGAVTVAVQYTIFGSDT
jgi:hypothetical protein